MTVYCLFKQLDEGADLLCAIYATREATEKYNVSGYYITEVEVEE